MNTYIIEREIPGVGGFDQTQLRDAARTSNQALAEVGPAVEWVNSYVTAGKTFCVYRAENEDAIRKHAEISGFPANVITEVVTEINPKTGD